MSLALKMGGIMSFSFVGSGCLVGWLVPSLQHHAQLWNQVL
jgi:hypothetical protein